MRLTGIAAEEMFSFDALRLADLPAHTVVLVGPNGSGKTNLFRLVEVVLAEVERVSSSSQGAHELLVAFAAGRRYEAVASRPSSIRIGIELTEPWEQELLRYFVQASVMSSLLRNTLDHQQTERLLAWIAEINDEALAPLTNGEIVTELVDTVSGQWTLGYEFDFDGERFRWVMEGSPSQGSIVRAADARYGIESELLGDTLGADGKRVSSKSFTLADLLPAPGKARHVLLEAQFVQTKEPFRERASLAGIPLESLQNRQCSLALVLRTILSRGLTVIGDLRHPVEVGYPLEHEDRLASDGSRVPYQLFCLKNGDAVERDRFLASQALFSRMTGLEFDVQYSQRQGGRSDDSQSLSLISPVVRRGRRSLPIAFAGAGVGEALLLSATLSDSSGRVAILDEPVRNLHPTLQRLLVDELRKAPGQFIVATHSPYLVAVGDDVSQSTILRFDIASEATRATRLVLGGGTDDVRLRKVLCESADARALIFARGVVLVEGGTELGALPEWFAKSPTASAFGSPDVLNLAIYSVDGDCNFKTYVHLLNGLGVPWAVVCDGAIFRFCAGKPQIFKQVLEAGAQEDELDAVLESVASDLPSFDQLREVGTRHGIFTMATGWEPEVESFEAYVENVNPGALDAAKPIAGSSKPRRGRYVASSSACPGEIDKLYSQLLNRLGIGVEPDPNEHAG